MNKVDVATFFQNDFYSLLEKKRCRCVSMFQCLKFSYTLFFSYENKPRRHAKGREEKMDINTIVGVLFIKPAFESSGPGLINQAVKHLQ